MIKLAIKNFLRDKGYFLTNCSAPGDLFFYEKYEKRSLEERKFYNIGPGDFKHQYWSNVDKFSDWYANDNKNCDLEYDLLKKDVLPIDNDSAEIVYSSHVIEHVWDEHVEVFMKEVYRVLKKDGIFRITCPDIDLAIKAYKEADIDFFRALEYPHSLQECFTWYCSNILDPDVPGKMTQKELERLFAENPDYYILCDHLSKRSNIEFQNKKVTAHVNWFNESKVMKMLEKAGFQKIEPSRYLQSSASILRDARYFDNCYPMMSLYVEAVK